MCDDGWSYYDARVACKQLGYGGTYFSYYSYAYFGSGSGSIWLDELGCSGSETSLFSCSSAGLGNHDCGHYEDAGVRCFCEYIHHYLDIYHVIYHVTLYAATGPSCTNGDVRLWSAYNTPPNEGIIQICNSGTWYAICHHYSYCYIGKTACVQLGYPGAVGK